MLSKPTKPTPPRVPMSPQWIEHLTHCARVYVGGHTNLAAVMSEIEGQANMPIANAVKGPFPAFDQIKTDYDGDGSIAFVWQQPYIVTHTDDEMAKANEVYQAKRLQYDRKMIEHEAALVRYEEACVAWEAQQTELTHQRELAELARLKAKHPNA